VITADVAAILHYSPHHLKRERWSALLKWHAQAVRIGKAMGLTMANVE
jgi:hypothetical protein